MDGVIADFVKAACELHGHGGYVPQVFNFYKYEWGMSSYLFWKKIDETPDFWLNIEKFEWTDDFINYLHKNKLPYTICTSPSLSTTAVHEKILWMRKHISPKFKDFQIGHQKYLMSNENHILVDDWEKNLETFKGPSILFPSPQNENRHITDPLTYAINKLEEFYST